MFVHPYCSSSFETGLGLKLSTKKKNSFLLQIRISILIFSDMHFYLLVWKNFSLHLLARFSPIFALRTNVQFFNLQLRWGKWEHRHCVKSVQIRSFFFAYFSVFGLNTEILNLRIQFKYGKIRSRKNSVFEHFSRSVCFI